MTHSDNPGRAAAIGIALLWALTTRALAQPSITPLNPAPGMTTTQASHLSRAGQFVLGNGATLVEGVGRWGPNRVGQALLPGTAAGMSQNGMTVVTTHQVWTALSGVQDIQAPAGTTSFSVSGVNGDGTIIVGGVTTTEPPNGSGAPHGEPCFWNGSGQGGTIVARPVGSYSAAFAEVAADQFAMVGTVSYRLSLPPYTVTRYPFIYANGAYQEVGTPGFGLFISDDGSIAGGTFNDPGTNRARTFRTSSSGFQDIGLAPGSAATVGHAMSGDGSVIVGTGDGVGAVLWRADLGVVPLSAFLTQRGVDLSGWDLSTTGGGSATGVMLDGCAIHICGVGRYQGLRRGFIVEIDLGEGADADGDGLCDNWEVEGIPYLDAQGVLRRYILDANGDGVSDASPLRKDLFVEVDAMAGRVPTPQALDLVKAVFAAAPVAAPPGGLPGIALHIQRDEMALPRRPYPNGLLDFQQDKVVYFGTAAERADAPNWTAKRQAKFKVYRYCIFGDRILDSNISGIAEGFGCNDFIVSLGAFPDTSGNPGGTEEVQAGTFMHELGHALGLRHGGGDDILFKPNYFSVMNYLWQMPYPSFNPVGTWQLGFSDHPAPPLLESALSETAGIGEFVLAPRLPFTVLGGTGLCPAPLFSCTHWASLNLGDPVDWNCNGVIDAGLVSVNLNVALDATNNPSGQLLLGHDDWNNLIYDFRTSPHYANGAPPIDIGPELTLEMHEYLSNLPPIDPGYCSADFNNDGDYGTDADIEAFFACLGGDCCPTCYVLGADFNGDGDYGTDADIEAFFRVLGGGSC